MAAPKKKPTHVIHVHPSNGIHIPGLGHHKRGKHQVVLTDEEVADLAKAEGITVTAFEEEKAPAAKNGDGGEGSKE